MNDTFSFDWSQFSPAAFARYQEDMRKGLHHIINNYYGSVYCGELCFDLVVYDVDDRLFLFADLYVGGEDTGYGYSCREAMATGKYASKQEVPDEEQYPYTDADGQAFPDLCIGLTYEEFKARAEAQFTDYIWHGQPGRTPSLEEKARMPLHIW